MYQILSDKTKGTIKITDSWSITGTGPDAPPQFLLPNDEFVFSFINISDVEQLKTFSMEYTGETENRYLETNYRISRDGNAWTSWLILKPNITNFPPVSADDPLYLDIKFIRKGSSTIGTIKLLEYVINGSIQRNLFDGESTVRLTTTNNEVIIKPPFIFKVFRINDIEILSDGVVDTNFTIKYRFSQDYGRTVTNWEPFTKENITTIRINPIRFFQIEYLINLIGNTTVNIFDINLIGDFQNVTRDYAKSNLYGVRDSCNSLILGLVNDVSTFPASDSGGEGAIDANGNPVNSSEGCSPQIPGGSSGMLSAGQSDCNLPQMTQQEQSNLFQPYQQQVATSLLDKISNDSNQLFGHDIVYFLTDPDKNGIDYTFHEYQLYNFVAEETFKVSVEGNQFPDNNGTINQFDLALFDSFEIHVPKVTFKTAFGVEKRPSKGDFLWFCTINKMFNVEHAQPFRGFNNNAIYYKVMLKKYNYVANITGVNQTITDKLRDLTRNSTIDELFGLEQIQDKKAVANKDQFRPLTTDPIRLTTNARIVKELVENGELIVSKSHYDLSSVGFSTTTTTTAVEYKNMKDYYEKGDNLGFCCWFNINNYTLNDTYRFFNYTDSQDQLGLNITMNGNKSNVRWNSATYSMDLTSGLQEEVWYSLLVNIDQRQRTISQYIYKRNVEEEDEASYLGSTKLKLVYSNTQTIVPQEFKLENKLAKLESCDMRITNIRLFLDVIPESQHTKLLNQYVLREDTKYLIFADNANQKLVLPNFPLNQIGKDEV